jgi:membrane-bound lytic murein transglycosylase D
MLGLAELYFPLFEEHLDKSNLPLELKYLAIVESALNPNAKSPSGAMGLWQFLLNAGKMFDLNVDSYVDERCDPYKSTVAACKYLEYLHRIFNDWQLALAAYNGGPGVVRNAIQRSGGKTTFWEIRPFLPKETQGYVPAFIAATYVMNYSAEHNIYPTKPKIFFNQTDTVHVKQSVNFNQISAFTDVPIDMIKFLNPSYKQNFIPYSNDEKILILPSEKISSFIKFEKEIYGLKTEKNDYNKLVANAGATDNKVKVVHVVKKGEYFHKIAMDYKCTVDNLIAWNNLSSYYLYAGQKLEIWVNPTYELMPESKTDLPKLVYYTVQYGDSIQSIANKFNIASASEILKENNISSESQLQPGVKLKIVSGTSN